MNPSWFSIFLTLTLPKFSSTSSHSQNNPFSLKSCPLIPLLPTLMRRKPNYLTSSFFLFTLIILTEPLLQLPTRCLLSTTLTLMSLKYFVFLLLLTLPRPWALMGLVRLYLNLVLVFCVSLFIIFSLSLFLMVICLLNGVYILLLQYSNQATNLQSGTTGLFLSCAQFLKFLKELYSPVVADSISTSQFGFMKGRSSQQQLLVMLNEIFSNKNSKTCSDIVYLDISKAFDSVSHDVLFLKLQLMGISGTILNWFKAYLDNRRQLVSVNGSFSGFLPVTSGVPQGSILGPLLFLIYINDLPDSVLFSKPLLFADDTKCLISSTKDVCSHNMQQDLDSLYQWSISNYMNFNQSKCVALRIPSIGLPPVYLLNGYSIPTTNLFKDLGVLLSGDLSWSAHINMIVTRAYKMLGLIRRCFSHTASVPVRRLLYTSVSCSFPPNLLLSYLETLLAQRYHCS